MILFYKLIYTGHWKSSGSRVHHPLLQVMFRTNGIKTVFFMIFMGCGLESQKRQITKRTWTWICTDKMCTTVSLHFVRHVCYQHGGDVIISRIQSEAEWGKIKLVSCIRIGSGFEYAQTDVWPVPVNSLVKWGTASFFIPGCDSCTL